MNPTVLDANVLASGLASHEPESVTSRIIDAWRSNRFTLVTSEHIIGEVADTLAKPYFRRYMTPDPVDRALQLLRHQALLTPISVTVRGAATHVEDDLVLATALSGHAHSRTSPI